MQETEYMEQNNKKVDIKKEIGKFKTFSEEFKKFISKGNVVDLAVAVVIGNAFNKIISSLVNDIIMPFIGVIIGGIDFTDIKLTIGKESILFGSFIQNIIDFLIISFSIFLVIKLMSKLKLKKEEVKTPPKTPDDILLLQEIRDLLKEKK